MVTSGYNLLGPASKPRNIGFSFVVPVRAGLLGPPHQQVIPVRRAERGQRRCSGMNLVFGMDDGRTIVVDDVHVDGSIAIRIDRTEPSHYELISKSSHAVRGSFCWLMIV